MALEYQRVGNEESMRYRICKPQGVFRHLYNDKGFIDFFVEFREAVEFMKWRSFGENLIEQTERYFGL